MKKSRKKRKCVSAYDRVMRRTKGTNNPDKCWLWCGPVNNAGFGMIRGDNGIPKMMTVHRAVAKHVGMDIENFEIHHICDHYTCVNPKHLKEGTTQERMKEFLKNRHPVHKVWQNKKNLYRTCEHCGGSSVFTWFSRHHKDCYTYIPTQKV